MKIKNRKLYDYCSYREPMYMMHLEYVYNTYTVLWLYPLNMFENYKRNLTKKKTRTREEKIVGKQHKQFEYLLFFFAVKLKL